MHFVELSSPWLFPIIFVLGEVPPCPSWSFKSPQLTNPFDNRASQSRWWIIICSESECINTTNELIIVFPSSVRTTGQAGPGESSPPLPYLGRRAGLVPNATIPSHRRQLQNNQSVARPRTITNFENNFCKHKTKILRLYSVGCEIRLRKLRLLLLRLCTWVVHDFFVMMHFNKVISRLAKFCGKLMMCINIS